MVPAPPPRRRPTGSGNTNAAALKAARLRSRTCSNGGDNESDDDCDPRPYADDMHHRYNTEQRHKRHLEDNDDHYSDVDHDEEDDEDEDDDVNLLRCLHCHTESTEIQVRCDECSAYICDSCHWCHEFQANHEIRVCDRCDAFYCRACDEVDQCDDCAEVVCASCSTLLSCKFCGGGICEECATACGRCGIVLCSRDAKFAVECDTCRLPYCLVCLASGTKDPCVRCRTRPSKRMEQLVHLRLKSIYKAFKQNSSTSKSTNPRDRQNDDPDDDHVTDDPEALFQAAASAAKSGAQKRGRSKYHSTDSTGSSSTLDKVIRFKEEKERADAMASALLAELDEEEEAEKVKMSKKKKKKKGRPLIKEDEKVDSHEIPDDGSSVNDDNQASSDDASGDDRKPPPTPPTDIGSISEPSKDLAEADPLESELCKLVANEDIDGLENLMESIKGIPGRAVLRKNAKKALKRLRQAVEDEQEEETLNQPEELVDEPKIQDAPPASAATPAPPVVSLDMNGKLRIVSYTHNKPPAHPSTLGPNGSQHRGANTGALRSECVMRIAPIIVGWVIGKGGQRIRDLMEESGARIWIDQNNLGVQDHRSVYVVGPRRNVEIAVDLIKGLVSKAPPICSPTTRQATPAVEPTGMSLKSSSVGAIPGSSDGTDVPLKPKINGTTDPVRIPVGNDGRTRHVMTCEPRFVPLLIGRRGWTIKNIQDTTGVKVDIDQSVNPRKITISGGADDNVQKAIRMVRDVLSYPHAQMPVGMEDDGIRESEEVCNEDTQKAPISLPPAPAPLLYSSVMTSEKEVVGSPVQSSPVVLHSHSPPSSLIMTGDARTTISTASSLSTTPEPDRHSTTTPFQIVDTSLVPSPAHSRDVVSGGRHDLTQSPFSRLPPPSPMAAPPVFHPQQPVPDFFAPRDVGFESLQLPGQSSHQMGHLLQQSSPSQQNRATFPSVGHSEFGSMRPQNAHGHVSFHPQNGYHLRVQSPNPNTFVKSNPAFWNGSHSPVGEFHDRPDPDGFRLDAAVDFLQHSQQSKPMSIVSRDANDFMGLSTPLGASQGIAAEGTLLSSHRGGDDALMIDSLFGPGPAVSGTSLLTGLQGISLNENTASTGLWGTADASDNIGLNGLTHLDPEPQDPLFTGMQPTLLTTERKAQSRFAWGEHSGF